MWRKRSNSQFKCPIIGIDWGIKGYNDVIVCVTVINLMNAFSFSSDWIEGYNDVIVCVTVINLMNAFSFHQTGSISSDKSRLIGLLIMNATITTIHSTQSRSLTSESLLIQQTVNNTDRQSQWIGPTDWQTDGASIFTCGMESFWSRPTSTLSITQIDTDSHAANTTTCTDRRPRSN